MHASRRRSLGVSLIEAMVALAVMGFGTLAVLGVQTSLRMNGDIARQRSEAVRVGHEEVHKVRAWATMDDYRALATAPDEVREAGNTSYTVRRTVADAAADDPNQARRKTLVLDVLWTDRTGTGQSIRLSTAIHGVAPGLAGSLAVGAGASYTRNPGGRHVAVPRDAVDIGGGWSRFTPPDSGGASWVFDNVSGYITKVCLGDACTSIDARLLAGHVRFATLAAGAPTAPDAESPPGSAVPIDVAVGAVACYERSPDVSGAVAYFCAVPVDAERRWSGRSSVLGRPAESLPLAVARGDADAAKFRICRYTPYREHRTVGELPTQMTNDEHPLDYAGVEESLLHQNFLVLRAGNGMVAYDCPPDGASPYANTNTWHHQPPT